MDSHTMTRRAFLAAATTTAVSLSAFSQPNTAKVVPRKLSPNEKLNVAGIGVGGQGVSDIMNCAKQKDLVNVVALCDVDDKNAEESFYRLPDAKRYKDYRKMFDEMGDQIDAVTITTPDHSHAPIAYTAMKLGKHARIQKPLTHTIAEARLLRKVAEESGVVAVMGNQGHSGHDIRDLCEFVWAKTVGEIKEVHVWTSRPGWPQGISEALPEEAIPATLDWDLWLGPAAMRPYNKQYVPFNWRGWWDFGCGAIGDMACHIIDGAFWALHLDKAPRYSVEVVAEEGLTPLSPPNKSRIRYEFPERETDHGTMGAVSVIWYDGGWMPERPESVPPEDEMGNTKNGSLFIGSKGYLTSGTYCDGSRLLPNKLNEGFKKPDQVLARVPDEDSFREWLKVCKDRSAAIPGGVSYLDYAAPLTEVANMGNVALRAGKKIEFEVASMKITNDAAANQYLTKEYRKPFDYMPL